MLRRLIKVISNRKAPQSIGTSGGANILDVVKAYREMECEESQQVENMENMRRECMAIYSECSERCDKLYALSCVKDALNYIPLTNCTYSYLQQYQYIINWYYFELRFLSAPADRQDIFEDAKERYRQIFEIQASWDDHERIASYCHWSQLCYEYAECVDEESLQWCIDIAKGIGVKLQKLARKNKPENPFEPECSFPATTDHEIARKLRCLYDALEGITDNVAKCQKVQNLLQNRE